MGDGEALNRETWNREICQRRCRSAMTNHQEVTPRNLCGRGLSPSVHRPEAGTEVIYASRACDITAGLVKIFTNGLLAAF